MLDAIQIERRGVPTLTITHDTFAVVAKAHAETMGMPDVPLLVEPTPKSGIVGIDIRQVVEDNAKVILEALVGQQG